MKKNRVIQLLVVFLLLSMLFSSLNFVFAKSNSTYEDEAAIKAVLINYFNLKYETLRSNSLLDFSSVIVEENPQMIMEMEKLDLETYSGEKRDSYIVSYKYDLEYIKFDIDETGQNAELILLEDNEIIYNLALKIDNENPPPTKTWDIEHKIKLIKTVEGWKISSDVYTDLGWKFIQANQDTNIDLKTIVDQNYEESKIYMTTLTEPSCGYYYDNSSREYNRNGAVDYARQYAESPNPAYAFFQNEDCTNFISQAIRHGSTSLMQIPKVTGQGTPGWYYLGPVTYAAAWTDVDSFYKFVIAVYFTDIGPQGCEISNKLDLRKGDVVQYDWNEANDQEWDHGIIITDRYEQGGEIIYRYASHTNNTLDGFLDNIYLYKQRRFLRIEHINDPDPTVFIPSLIKSSSAALSSVPETIAIEESSSLNSAYPAPGAESENLPTETTHSAYP